MIFRVVISFRYSDIEFDFKNSETAMTFAKRAANHGEDGVNVTIKIIKEEEEHDNEDNV